MKQLEVLGGLLDDGSVWRMRALAERGITAATVRRAVAAGLVQQVSRGIYRSASVARVPHQDLAELMARVPGGLVCLHTAANLHGLGDVPAARAWVALPVGRRVPSVEWPPAKFVRWSRPTLFSVGVERRVIAGVPVDLTNPARTVVDMLARMDLVGEDRAYACLRDYVSSGQRVAVLTEIAAAVGWLSRVGSHLRSAAAFEGPR